MNNKLYISLIFGITTTIAFIRTYIGDKEALIAWSISIVCLTSYFLLTQKYYIISLTRSYDETLTKLGILTRNLKNKKVFSFAGFANSDLQEGQEFITNLEKALIEDKIDILERYIVLRTDNNKKSAIKFMNKYYSSSKFSLNVSVNFKAPINIFTITPNKVVIGFPRKTGESDWGDSMALFINSKFVYSAIQPFCESIIKEFEVLKKVEGITEKEKNRIVRRIKTYS